MRRAYWPGTNVKISSNNAFNWRLLKDASTEMGVPAIDVFDQNYGTVKAYHASVWMAAYAVSINPQEAA